jgi:hypothetical protein
MYLLLQVVLNTTRLTFEHTTPTMINKKTGQQKISERLSGSNFDRLGLAVGAS